MGDPLPPLGLSSPLNEEGTVLGDSPGLSSPSALLGQSVSARAPEPMWRAGLGGGSGQPTARRSGRGLVGCRLWGRTESDTTEVT